MSGQSRRAHQRIKDDRRVCRAQLKGASGGSVELSVIDMGAGGAALCGAKDTSRIPQLPGDGFGKGHIKFRIPSGTKNKTYKTVDVGPFEVVRQWGRGPGEDAGIAVRFMKPHEDYLRLLGDQKFLSVL
jgi:hypothetical protein